MTIENTNTHPTTTYDPTMGNTTMPEVEPPEKAGEISSKIQRLDEAIKALDAKIIKLQERLAPVLNVKKIKLQENLGGKDIIEEEANTEIGKTLQGFNNSIENQAIQIEDILSDLEL